MYGGNLDPKGKDFKDKFEDDFSVTIHLGKEHAVCVEISIKGDKDKCSDYFIDWIHNGCIQTFYEMISNTMLDEDDYEYKVILLKEFLEQLQSLTKRELSDKIKGKQEIKDNKDESNDKDESDNNENVSEKDSAIGEFGTFMKNYFKL